MRSATRVFGSTASRSLLIGRYWQFICDRPVHERSGKTDWADFDGGANPQFNCRSRAEQREGMERKGGRKCSAKLLEHFLQLSFCYRFQP
jgi:hypothetical protein